MRIQVSAQMLLVVAIVLLAANLVLMFAVHGASPAQAQARTCVGLAAAGEGDHWAIYRAWSDGTVDVRSGKPTRISF